MATSKIQMDLIGIGDTQLRAYSKWVNTGGSISFACTGSFFRLIVHTLGTSSTLQGEYLISELTNHSNWAMTKIKDATDVGITYNNGTLTISNNATAGSILLIIESWNGALTFS